MLTSSVFEAIGPMVAEEGHGGTESCGSLTNSATIQKSGYALPIRGLRPSAFVLLPFCCSRRADRRYLCWRQTNCLETFPQAVDHDAAETARLLMQFVGLIPQAMRRGSVIEMGSALWPVYIVCSLQNESKHDIHTLGN